MQTLASTAPLEEPGRRLDVSIGIAEFRPPTDSSTVLEAADAALYRAKSDPHRRVYV